MNMSAGSFFRMTSGVSALVFGASLMAIGGASSNSSFMEAFSFQMNWTFLFGILLVLCGGILLQRWGAANA